MESELQIVFQLLAALAIGFLVGIERGWSGQKESESDPVAGIRTFSLIGLLGGVWAMISQTAGEWILAIAFAAVAAMAIVSYLMNTRKSDNIGTTTAYTQMVTFVLGAWAALGYHLYALGTAVLVVALLGMKPVLHRWLRGIETKEIYAGIKLLVISLVLLPLLPDQGYGPWESINPRWIWWMVVLICGISFIGYFSIKHIGNRKGTLVTSITGGLASSTAVTLSMAEFARNQLSKSLFMSGVMFASSIMFIRVMVEVAIVNPMLLSQLWIPLFVMFSAVLSGALWLWKHRSKAEEPLVEIDNPFNIGTALKFGAFLTLILFLSAGMEEWFGNRGIYILSVISGIMDVNAITLSLSRLAINDISGEVAVFGIILAAVTNTLAKGFIFAFFTDFRESLKLIGLMLLAGLAGLITAAVLVL
ncbi:MAG: MgtC/SapB family protein [Balneolaceae bacterium]